MLLVAKRINVISLNQFHREEHVAIVGGSRIKNPRDVGMVHDRQHISFCFEPSVHRSRMRSANKLDGETALDWFFLFGFPNSSHSALADLVQQDVGANFRNGWKIGFSLFIAGLVSRPNAVQQVQAFVHAK